ncbi:accessory gene regulator B [Clostridium pasteurianum DSM 525 = ATCC 6013]|uniref:Accessory gene regulator B n=1 Tax=Clostridium pasteurianum DSM 525 = ATCC 6013 TaxID=1262449 RepID=A0A0H3J517_CLOPA|nr:accessory gene regulator B family protein [Clostridium pasteurianum]AJA48132.1 accessory gene regulator B [Clostridium pasteurianum DSM 525 = ATCC 6013]AJA52120.1 accessory gene regulator B [Clostridium pasteurianum DSM 525 = ATCC 6013]AOZ75398.1 accessory regulator AgrB [Clostridium pasteurianum DSM 525 = ATCC 6013]AOZ79193.1 accessory regulator AgrB [Clostridium pasteurianum]ELP60715.1 AgrB-like protein [Clostridium pasteurianum DSM 525 = ATCC 6013]
MNTLISSFVKKISESNPGYSELDLKKMEYGLICFIDEITKFVPYFIIFWILSLQKYYIIALLFFCPIRLFSGGYHAKTYWGCFFISFIVFFMIIICGKYLIINTIIIISLLIISFILICIFSPVDNINKPIKSKERRLKLKYYSIFITLFLIIACYFIPNRFLNTAAISIVSATAMMMIGKINTNFTFIKTKKSL